ncbi:unnamed protein product [Ilex paraguariensis]|uniref:Uncharacterized protein n=1 Tax=Ilex paraguariensis TaxID=185542 RepID=A0ABC8TRB2_9AQUA
MSPLRKIALFTIASSSPDEEAIGRDGEHGGRGRRADPDVGGADGGVEAHSDEMQKDDPNPEKCLDKGHQVTRCVLRLWILLLTLLHKIEVIGYREKITH